MSRGRLRGHAKAVLVAGLALAGACLVGFTGCPSVLNSVEGPAPGTPAGVGGNSRPTVTVQTPNTNIIVTEGDTVTVVWSVNDTAGEVVTANLSVVDILTNQSAVNLVVNQVLRFEDKPITQTSSFNTSGLAGKTYLVSGTASDGVNPLQESSAPGTVQVVTAGTEPTSARPRITLLTPEFSQSVAQGDTVTMTWNDDDPDSAALIVLVLDLDSNSNNDNPFRTDDPGLVVLGQAIEDQDPVQNPDGTITNPLADTFAFKIDVSRIPVRPDGQPYFPRATITDGANPAVHSYSAGKLFVTQLAESPMSVALGTPESVDLGRTGLNITGVTFLGFNPGAYCGSRMRTAGDFDGDGANDFVLVARFGRPFGYPANVARGVPQGSVGEAYLIYGHPSRQDLAQPNNPNARIPGPRYGGRINANSTSTSIPGVIFAAPPPDGIIGDNAGITDFAPVADQPFQELNGDVIRGDGRPELLFGLAHHNGVPQARDDDPGDSEVAVEFPVGGRGSVGQVLDSYTSAQDPSGGINCTKSLLVVDRDADDLSMDAGPFVAYLTFDLDVSAVERLLGILEDPEAELEASLVLFINEPGDDMSMFAINLFVNVDPCNVPGDGFLDEDLVAIEDVAAGEPGLVETDVTDFVTTSLFSGRTSFAFLLRAQEDAGEPGEQFDTVRIRSADSGVSPRLEIRVTREEESRGCYPDPFSNNLSNSEPGDDPGPGGARQGGAIREYLGIAVLASSENRDCSGIVNPVRWERDAVPLELIGQQGLNCPQPGGQTIFFGARWQSTLWDWVDHLSLFQPPVEDLFGECVDSMPDMNNDQIGELIFSAPTLEQDQANLLATYGRDFFGFPISTHAASRGYFGSVFVQLGFDVNDDIFKENAGDEGNSTFPNLPDDVQPAPVCGEDPEPRQLIVPAGLMPIFAENMTDRLGGARYAGDFNQDFSPDIVMGAPLADPPGAVDGGKAYILYGRAVPGPVFLSEANVPGQRPPMLRIFGDRPNDQLGLVQGLQQDFNGDGFDDVIVASKLIDSAGQTDNGAVAIILGNQPINGDRQFSEIGTPRLKGLIFYGDNSGAWAGADAAGSGFFDTQRDPLTGRFSGVATGGDFNGDGFGDILIAAPGEVRTLSTGQQRQGVVYLIFGRSDLFDPAPGASNSYPLSMVGSTLMPGVVFIGPYEPGTLDADGSVNALGDIDGAPNHVGWLGDINGDGFDDIMIGNTRADFVDPDAPDQRRPDAGEAYLIYGNNFGRNNPANW